MVGRVARNNLDPLNQPAPVPYRGQSGTVTAGASGVHTNSDTDAITRPALNIRARQPTRRRENQVPPPHRAESITEDCDGTAITNGPTRESTDVEDDRGDSREWKCPFSQRRRGRVACDVVRKDKRGVAPQMLTLLTSRSPDISGASGSRPIPKERLPGRVATLFITRTIPCGATTVCSVC